VWPGVALYIAAIQKRWGGDVFDDCSSDGSADVSCGCGNGHLVVARSDAACAHAIDTVLFLVVGLLEKRAFNTFEVFGV
jgi:hypothetical protein